MYPRYKHSKIQHRRKRGCFFILENTKWHLNAYVVVLSVLKDINNLKHPVALEKHTWQQHYIFLHVHDRSTGYLECWCLLVLGMIIVVLEGLSISGWNVEGADIILHFWRRKNLGQEDHCWSLSIRMHNFI